MVSYMFESCARELIRIVDFNIQVLASNNWPFGGQAVDYTVPTQVEGTYNRFNEFHGEVHKYV
jgi:cullin 1